jgi:hypothetical protein
MTACQEATEACLESKEPTSELVAVHDEVPKEEAAVKTVRALKKRYGDWHLAVGHCRQLKKWTQGDGGSQKKVATTSGGMTAVPFQHRTTDTVVRDQAGTMLQEGPQEDGHLGRHIRHNRNATTA